MKQAAECLKRKVWEKLGEGITSSIANGIINALADTGSAVAATFRQVSLGNQLALEATGGMLAGTMLAGKKIPHVSTGIISESVTFSAKQ
ncbi:hypothetical protein [Pantoea agglomerans]|uniref:hypothetical protein n=1 Tax=Enterobacter agglomerans TaxID=549 RepID=UPI0024134578|nr:hypothetical protein [Pantoea agglomerans]